jgi:hypothetical protein
MGEASDETLTLLQELALLKKGEHPKSRNAAARQKRRKEIGKEIKEIADKKKEERRTENSGTDGTFPSFSNLMRLTEGILSCWGSVP